MNKVILSGYVGGDPQMRFVERRPVASFSLATDEPARRTPDGREIPKRTEWHRIVMTDEAAEFAEKYIRKGTRLLLEGTLRTRVWQDAATIKHSVTEIYVHSYEIIGR